MLIAFVVLCMAPTIGFSIASYIIATENKDISCDNGAVVELSTWLYVNASVGLFSCLLLLITLILVLTLRGFGSLISLPYICVLILNSFFLISWNIIGAVSVFRDSMDCKHEAKPIFIMVIIALAFQWFSLLVNCCKSCCSYKVSVNTKEDA